MPTEEYAIVLDYLPEGRTDMMTQGYKREKQIAQIIGEDYFTLIEVVIRPEKTVNIGDRLYIGQGVREEIHHIKKRLNYDELTSTARVEADYTIEKIVKEREKEFVRWFNECGSLTTRLHRLELLPGVGKKHMWDINKIRMGKPFESYKDIAERVKLLPDPAKLIIKRIIWELRGDDDKGKPIKYKIFVGTPLFPGEERKPRGPPAGQAVPSQKSAEQTDTIKSEQA